MDGLGDSEFSNTDRRVSCGDCVGVKNNLTECRQE